MSHFAKSDQRTIEEYDDPGIQLMLQFQQGDPVAFASLFEEYYRPIFKFSCRMLMNSGDAEEITQETFIQVYKAAPRYQPTAKFSTWIYTIAKNLCLNKLKAKKQVGLMETIHGGENFSLDEVLASSDPLPATELEQQERANMVKRAIESLPPLLRIPIILSRYQELSNQEIASITGCSETAIKLRIHRAMGYLAKKLKRYVKG